jgi:hypothetical protein
MSQVGGIISLPRHLWSSGYDGSPTLFRALSFFVVPLHFFAFLDFLLLPGFSLFSALLVCFRGNGSP